MTDTLIPQVEVQRRCGGVSAMTLWRYRRDDYMPQPVRLRNRLFWREQELEDWLESRRSHPPAQSAA